MVLPDNKRRHKLEEIYLRYKKDMFLTAYDMVKNKQVAEDIVHDAVMRIYKHLDKFSDLESNQTRSYVIIIVKNLCRDYFNKDKVKGVNVRHYKPIEDFVNVQDSNAIVELGIIKRDEISEMKDIIELLNPAYSEIIKLRYYDELSIDEIADILGITSNNVSVRLNRAINSAHKVVLERNELYEKSV